MSNTKVKKQRKSPQSLVIEKFTTSFNSFLDASPNVPSLHYGRQSWVAERYGVTTSAAGKWMSGQSMPSWENIIRIADDFGTTIDEMVGHKPATFRYKTLFSAGGGAATESVLDGSPQRDSAFNFVANTRQVGIMLFVVPNDAMSPDIKKDDVVIINPVSHVKNGRIYQFVVMQNNRTFIRQALLTSNNKVRLVARDGAEAIELPLEQLKSEKCPAENGHAPKLVGEITWILRRIACPEK